MRLGLASEQPGTCTGPPHLPSPQGAEQEARKSHLGVLVDRLREATKVYAGNNRLGAGKSLGAVIDYFDEMELPQDLGAPLFALLAALNDLENGKQPDMLKASSPPSSPAG